ncbi:MAG: YqhA family protein [Desulfovibrionaceae bacterium]|nr:YqhA family protein [Desulfovibrionaceae bacterium]
MRMAKNIFETFLCYSRFITLFAVLGALFSSVIMFIKGTMKIVSISVIFWGQITGTHDTAHSSDTLVALFVSSVDIYLFATVLLIFSTGLYELFISKVDSACLHQQSRPNWLKVGSLDDLKSSLGKVILMILIVWFFEQSLIIEYRTALDLLYLGVSILLVSAALFLTHGGHTSRKRPAAE